MKHSLRNILLLCISTFLMIGAHLLDIDFFTRVLESPRPASGSLFAESVGNAGDYDNDGYDDFIVGAPLESNLGQTGWAYVFSGASGLPIDTLGSPWMYSSGGWFGLVVGPAGDIDQNGFDDVMVAAPIDNYNDNNGIVFVFSGATGDTLFTLGSPNTEGGSKFGSAIDTAGDVNNDGYTDIIVGAPYECPEDFVAAGRAYVFSGLDGSLIHTLEPLYPAHDGNFGTSVSALDDINDDGFDDVIVGAHGETVDNEYGAGRVYIFCGATGDTLHAINALAPQNGGSFGDAVEEVKDLNEDGIRDFAVGSSDADFGGSSWVGRVYLMNGATGEMYDVINMPDPEGASNFGYAVKNIGDVNSNSYDDLLISASGVDINGEFNTGRAYLVDGATRDTLATFIADEPISHLAFSESLGGGGDINNDGIPDFIIGNPRGESTSGIPTAGKARVYASGEFIVGIPSPVENPLQRFTLRQNHPNPFNPSTVISLRLSVSSDISVTIYDVNGRSVRELVNRSVSAGVHKFVWDGTNETGLGVPSGVYFYQLQLDGRMVEARKMVLAR